MSANLYEFAVSTNPVTDFLEPLASNACSADVEVVLPDKRPLWYMRAISIVSNENLDYEVWLFSNAVNLGGTLASEKFIGAWQFNALIAGPPAAPGYQVTPQGGALDPLFHWYVDGNMLPIRDLDSIAGAASTANAKLHCRLINRNAVSKTAGAGGALTVTFWVGPQMGW